jgi:MoaA/NifB/PqqE/SkfB family radical SAM enzyme
MACIEKIYSVSAVLGGPACNADCSGCAGKVLRDDIKKSGEYNKAPRNIVAASRLALNYGAWTLSLTSSGEPTLYPEAITDTLETLKKEGVSWPFINLFTNGITINEDWETMEANLLKWKELGLTSVVISIHSVDPVKNGVAYGKSIMETESILEKIRSTGLCAKIVLLLGKDNVGTLSEYKHNLDILNKWGVGLITSWELRTNDGKRIAQTPSRWEMFKIRMWLMTNTTPVMGHVWGGMVRSYKGMNIRLTDYVSKHSRWNNYLRQLVLLPGGKVSYSWFQKGMFCLD